MNNKNLLIEMNEALAMIPDLEYRAECLGTEDFGLYVSKIGNYFTEKLNVVSKIFNSGSTKLTNMDRKDMFEQSRRFLKLERDVKGIVASVSYDTVKGIESPIMLGQKVNMVVAVRELMSINKLLSEDINKNLDAVDTVVSKMMTDVEHKKQITKSKVFDTCKSNADKISKVIDSIIDSNGTEDMVPIKRVIPNISSLSDLYNDMRVLSTSVGYKDIETMNSNVKKISEKVETLYEIAKNGELGKTSKNSLIELGEGLESTARYMTMGITAHYMINQTTDNILSLITILKSNIK